jgi:branched-chain amino acid transport system substrate-binding protein
MRGAQEEPDDRGLTRRGLLKGSVMSGGFLIAGGGFGGLLAGCGGGGAGSSGGGGGTTTGVTDKEIKLGLTSGNTGPYPDAGRQYTGWLQRTLEAKNKAGGVNGRKFKLVVLDDGGDTERAVANVQRLIREEQVFAMCALGSGTTAAFMDMLVGQKVPLLFPGASFDALFKPNPGVYALFPGYDVQTGAITKWAVKTMGPGSAVIVRANLPTWDQPTKQARDAITNGGGKVAAVINTAYGQPEWGSVVTRIKSADPDYVVMISTALDCGALWKELTTRGATPKKAALGVSSIVDPGFVRAAGNVPDGKVFGTVASTLPPGDPATKALQGLWPAERMGPYGLQGALAGDTIAAVFEKLGKDVSREGLTKLLDSKFGPFKTDYSSEIKSSSSHLLTNGISVATITGGEFGPSDAGFIT